jgi:heme/copper-type cytochrome/quinol oxidase subunit 2
MLIEIFLLAVGSMFWPALLAVDVVALRTDRPVGILTGFLAGGIVATVFVGCAIVFSLEHTALVTRSKHTTNAVVSIVLGAAALVAAYFVRRSDTRRTAKPKSDGSSKLDRLGRHGPGLAFVTGVVINIFPGVFPFIAMKDIAELGYSTVGTIAVIVGFYLVMFIPVEGPIVSFLVAPKRTKKAVASFNAWLDLHLRELAWIALAVVGTFELVRGVLAT